MRCGASYSTRIAPARSAASLAIASRASRAAALVGRNPSNRNGPGASPAALTSAVTALGPGIGTTAKPASCAAATMAVPGSLIAGVPASLTSATSCPSASSASTRVAASASLCAWALNTRALDPAWRNSTRVTRVSSAATAATARSVSLALGLRSER